MPSLITVLGSFLVAAGTMYPWSAAVAADRPPVGYDRTSQAADPAPGSPWWSNPPTTTPSADPEYRVPGPKVTEYAPARSSNSGPKVTDIAPPDRPGTRHDAELSQVPGARHVPIVGIQTADLAPDPPSSRQSDALPAAFQQASAPVAERTRADDSVQPARVNSLRSLHHPATEPATSPVPPAPAADAPPLATSVPPTTKQDSVSPLALGSHNSKNPFGKSSSLSAMITVGGSLAIVLGLFFIVAWAMRKTAPRGSLVLPKEVFEILGRAPLGARQQVQLLRCGNKLLLVSITPGGTETLTEVTDPLEVDHIAGICQQAHPKSSTTAFRKVFQQLAPKAGEPSELDDLPPVGARRKRYRWEEDHA